MHHIQLKQKSDHYPLLVYFKIGDKSEAEKTTNTIYRRDEDMAKVIKEECKKLQKTAEGLEPNN